MEPTIIKVPSHFNKKRTKTVNMLVVHAMAEWVIDSKGICYYCVDLLNSLKLSVHAYCLPDGRIIQSVKPELMAHHAGEKYNPQSIGMEFLVRGAHNYDTFLKRLADVENPPYTKAQYRSGAWWFREMAKQYDLTFEQVRTHRELAPDRKKDPGDAFDWNRFKTEFNKT